MKQTILLVGATGMFGSQIARALLRQPQADLRLLLRPSDDATKHDLITSLTDGGATVIHGDLADAVSIDRATRGIDVVVSAVQGGQDVIIDGQLALATIGKRNCVRRILPSDFALDLFKATPGEHRMFDLRRQADAAIESTGIEHVHVLQGAFMEMFGPGMGTVDYDAGLVTFYGDGRQIIECTSVRSAAAMVARVAVDTAVRSGKFAFAGDRISILDATRVIEAQTGRAFTRRSKGSERDLRASMRESRDDPMTAVMLAYQLYMLNGQTALSDLQNERYPDVKLERFEEFAARALPHSAART